MFAKINTAGLKGIEGFAVEVEADVQTGLPGFFLTGALSAETREAQYRIMNAIKNSGIHMEPKKVTVNFSPAAVRKDGTAYDLPIAIAVLAAYGMVDYLAFEDTAFFGETGLDGSLKRVRGALPLAFTLKEHGFRRIITSSENAAEAGLADGVEVIGCRDIKEVLDVLASIAGEKGYAPCPPENVPDQDDFMSIEEVERLLAEAGCDDGTSEASEEGFSGGTCDPVPGHSLDNGILSAETGGNRLFEDTVYGGLPAEDNASIYSMLSAEAEDNASVYNKKPAETNDLSPADTVGTEGSLQKMRPAGSRPGTVTAGNICEADNNSYSVDFSDVHGQEYLKRAAEIAVSGRHNLLLSGAAGTGKTMIAKRMPTIMPALSREEDIEISKIYSICGLLSEDQPLLGHRPFRSPHHGISEAAFAGGGNQVMPGEMSLASGGILFLDELPLFQRNTLEMLRQPMEDKRITVTRMKGSYTYPADFILVGAMNNCACGHYPDRSRCHCTRAQIKAYVGRLSKPLLERIDICAEARPIGYSELIAGKDAVKSESSAEIRRRVEETIRIQEKRFSGHGSIRFNGQMGIREIEEFCVLGPEETEFMEEVYKTRGLSGRTYHKILKVARTIADMDKSENILIKHLAEAVQLRSVEDSLFGNLDKNRNHYDAKEFSSAKTIIRGKKMAGKELY